LLQYASTAAKSYILNYMWKAAYFIIEGRMQPYGRKLCTVAVHGEHKSPACNKPA